MYASVPRGALSVQVIVSGYVPSEPLEFTLTEGKHTDLGEIKLERAPTKADGK